MKKQSYVPTTLGQYLNENRSITLTRQYGDKDAVVVGSRAPLRNQVLAYVMENAKEAFDMVADYRDEVIKAIIEI